MDVTPPLTGVFCGALGISTDQKVPTSLLNRLIVPRNPQMSNLHHQPALRKRRGVLTAADSGDWNLDPAKECHHAAMTTCALHYPSKKLCLPNFCLDHWLRPKRASANELTYLRRICKPFTASGRGRFGVTCRVLQAQKRHPSLAAWGIAPHIGSPKSWTPLDSGICLWAVTPCSLAPLRLSIRGQRRTSAHSSPRQDTRGKANHLSLLGLRKLSSWFLLYGWGGFIVA
jgi:hypothetical protein